MQLPGSVHQDESPLSSDFFLKRAGSWCITAFILRLFGCDSPPLWLRSSPSSPSSSSSTSSLPIRCSLPRRHFNLRQPLACTWDVATSARLLSCSNNYRESQFSAILQQTGSLRRTSHHAHSAVPVLAFSVALWCLWLLLRAVAMAYFSTFHFTVRHSHLRGSQGIALCSQWMSSVTLIGGL